VKKLLYIYGMKKQFNIRLDDRTRYGLAELADIRGQTYTQVIIYLIEDQLRREHHKKKTQTKLAFTGDFKDLEEYLTGKSNVKPKLLLNNA